MGVDRTDAELIARYKANYHIDPDANIDIEMIMAHWNLERQLRHDLLDTTPENRWEVFEQSYTRLYGELAWLNELSPETGSNVVYFKLWQDVIGPDAQKILEVGSGKGELASYLALQGYHVKATEITRERGEKWVNKPSENLTWGITDGVHLTNFEAEASYDVVVSNQVIEHMHPDDVPMHFAEVWKVLKPGGRYVLSTPHEADGPADVTRVFGYSEVMGMHLKEYTYASLRKLLTDVGFKASAVLRLPKTLRRQLNARPIASHTYLQYLMWLEKWLLGIEDFERRQRIVRGSKALLFTGNIMMVAQKS